MRTVIPLSICCLFLISCGKKQSQKFSYIPGRVVIGLKDIPIDSAFALINREGLYILSVQYYEYISGYPKDSFAAVSHELLDTKSYINKPTLDTTLNGVPFNVGGWNMVTLDSVKGVIKVSCTLTNMNTAAQTDWLATIQQLQLTDEINHITKTVYVKVPPGTEQAVINKMRQDPNVEYAEVNGLGNILY